MSAKNEFDTKILDDEAPESGYLSGPLSSQLLSSEDLDVENEKNQNDSDKRDTEKPHEESDKKVICESSELDSGLGLSECLSNFKLSDCSQTDLLQAPLIVEPEQNQQGIPLAILFRPDKDGDTQLHIAAVHGCEKSVGTLIRVCPDKILFDIPNDYGQTPLHLAVMGGHAVVTRMLVRAGASLGARDRTGETPLHKAVNHTKVGKHMDCLHALLAPVTEHPPKRLSSILDQKNYNGQAAVHLAASTGHVETLRALVSYGADINAREGLGGSTALHVAVRRGDAPTARWLLQRCGATDRHATDYAGRTPRRLARRSPLRPLFDDDQSDDDSDDDETYDSSDSDGDSIMEMLRQTSRSNQSLINVA